MSASSLQDSVDMVRTPKVSILLRFAPVIRRSVRSTSDLGLALRYWARSPHGLSIGF